MCTLSVCGYGFEILLPHLVHIGLHQLIDCVKIGAVEGNILALIREDVRADHAFLVNEDLGGGDNIVLHYNLNFCVLVGVGENIVVLKFHSEFRLIGLTSEGGSSASTLIVVLALISSTALGIVVLSVLSVPLIVEVTHLVVNVLHIVLVGLGHNGSELPCHFAWSPTLDSKGDVDTDTRDDVQSDINR